MANFDSKEFLNYSGLQNYDKLIKEEITKDINSAINKAKIPTISVDEKSETLIIK